MKSVLLLLFLTCLGASAECGGNDYSEDLPRYTPPQSDWSPTCDNVDDHTPAESLAWDGTIYSPVDTLDLANPHDESVFYDLMCPKNSAGKAVLRGIRQLFDQKKPFADVKGPTKAEVDHWNADVLNHLRAMVGMTEGNVAKPEICIAAGALWANERRHLSIWDTEEYGVECPKTGSSGHCGASFVPKTLEEQKPYLPEGHGLCVKKAGSEGAFGHSSSDPWSMKAANAFCGTLKAEGFWGGHTGPWWSREFFGFGFWQGGSFRAKWTGNKGPVKYQDPRDDMFNKLDGQDASCTAAVCEGIDWETGTTVDTTNDCRDYVLANDACSDLFFTFLPAKKSCACYPPDKEKCGEVSNQAMRNTFWLEPVNSGSGNIGAIPAGGPYFAKTSTGQVKSIKDIKWRKQCGDNINWLGTVCNRQQCLELIFATPECGESYALFNANGPNSCACYPKTQGEFTEADCINSSGREFYDVVDGCSGVIGENLQPDECGVCNGNNDCFGPGDIGGEPGGNTAGTGGNNGGDDMSGAGYDFSGFTRTWSCLLPIVLALSSFVMVLSS